MEKYKWTFGFNRENFEGSFATREEAIQEAKSLHQEAEMIQDYVYRFSERESPLL